MLATKCPGQDMRYWTADDIHEEECPECGEAIEFFKTDIRLRCRNCKTRVANPRFNMGCAQWCAYAEQCLGPGAKGLKAKSLKEVMEDELKRTLKDLPDQISKVKSAIEKAEAKCTEAKIDLLPVVAALVIITLKQNQKLDDVDQYLDQINSEHTLPQQAVKETRAIVHAVLTEDNNNPAVPIINELLR